jgi:hypothetical protein
VKRHGAYTSPSGERHQFDYENVSRSTPLRRGLFEFTNVNGGYAQTNGHGARTFPMVCFFSGGDCDLAADAFEKSLTEDGIGRFEHPLYGPFPAVAVGEIARRDDLVTAANQSAVEVTFFRTLRSLYPTGQRDDLGAIATSRAELAAQASQEFAEYSDLTTTAARENAVATVSRLLEETRSSMSVWVSDVSEQSRSFGDALDGIDSSLGSLIGAPATLASEVFAAVESTVDAARFEDSLNGLDRLLAALLADPALNPTEFSSGETVPASELSRATNGFHVTRVFALAAVSASAAIAAAAEYRSRTEALTAAAEMAERFDDVVAWSEAGIVALEQLDTGAAYERLHAVVAGGTGYLVRSSFDLAIRRTLVTTRYRTLLDVASEVYGEVDARLDELIADNDLSGDEILLISPGRELVYYA